MNDVLWCLNGGSIVGYYTSIPLSLMNQRPVQDMAFSQCYNQPLNNLSNLSNYQNFANMANVIKLAKQ